MLQEFGEPSSFSVRQVIGACGLVGFLLAGRSVVAGPITSDTALPVREGGLIVRSQAMLTRSTDDPSPIDRELIVWAAPSVLVYGATERLTLFGIVPYLDKSLDVTTPAGRRTRGDNGIGDLRFLARYTVWQWDRQGETLRLAPFIGLELPTGDDDETDSLGRLPQPLQLGSGSWDPTIGTVFSWQTFPWQLDTSLTYQLNTEANDFEFGDEARLDFSFQYRLWPRELGKGVPGFLYGVIESNLIWQDKNQLSGADDPDSGGTTWFLAPGIQYVTRRTVWEAAVQVPVIQDLNGSGLGNDFIVTAGFRVCF